MKIRIDNDIPAKTAVLFDQSYHMSDYYVEGPDVRRLVSDVAVNSVANFERNVAKLRA